MKCPAPSITIKLSLFVVYFFLSITTLPTASLAKETKDSVDALYRKAKDLVLSGDDERLLSTLRANPGLASHADENGWGLVHEAARKGSLAVLRALTAAGVDYGRATRLGQSPLDLAKKHRPDERDVVGYVGSLTDNVNYLASNGHLKTLERVYATRPEALKEADENDWTVLHEAARKGDMEMMKFLRRVSSKIGLDIGAKTKGGMNMMQIAEKYNSDNFELHDFISSWSYDFVHVGAGKGNLNLLQAVHDEDIKLDVEDHNGWQPMHQAIRAGHLDVVEFLLSVVSFDVNKQVASGHNALDIARKYHGEDHEIYKLLEEL